MTAGAAAHAERPAPVSTVLLAAASGLSVFGMASVVPAMPAFARAFDADYAHVQLVVSAYLFGLAIAQPVHGALSDMFGRRVMLLAGFAIFVVASALCVLAKNLETLTIGRFVQAVGVSVGTVAARAIVRDTHSTEHAGIALSYITAAMGIAPVIAPLVGGLLADAFGWQAIFAGNAVLGLALLSWVGLALPETRARSHRLAPDPVRTLLHYGEFLRSRPFLGYTLIYGFSSAAMFAFITVGASLYQRYAGLDAGQFGILWGGLALTYASGAWLGAKLARRRGTAALLRDGVLATIVVGVTFPLLIAVVGADLWTLTVPVSALMIANGMTSPLALAGAVSIRPELAGIASGLSSALAMLASVFFTAVSGATFDGSAMPAALLIAVGSLAVGGAWWLTRAPAGTS
jgi:DHA1 family bicyclomycin/chloramphenicol resistance-like MFS transporter